MADLTVEQVWECLEGVKDPEIPVVSVVEMGIVRQVSLEGGQVVVVMSPTFTGCPALDTMRSEIERRLRQAGAEQVKVEISLSPAWCSDWITVQGREKLRSFGLAPPPRHAGQIELGLIEAVACPYCASRDTSLKNDFGPTLCRSIYYCNACRQPFERFKPI
jgi:ring-1,2-phenylacetyl-CoA epoxidase subunit PaaD